MADCVSRLNGNLSLVKLLDRSHPHLPGGLKLSGIEFFRDSHRITSNFRQKNPSLIPIVNSKKIQAISVGGSNMAPFFFVWNLGRGEIKIRKSLFTVRFSTKTSQILLLNSWKPFLAQLLHRNLSRSDYSTTF